MLKAIFLLWSCSFASPGQPHRFEIKFYNKFDSCVRTVSETEIEKVDWALQFYTIKKEKNISEIYIYGGHIRFYFDGIEVMEVSTFDFYSSFALPERPYVLTTNSRLTFQNSTLVIMQPARRSVAFDSFVADRRIRQYLIDQRVGVE